MDTGTLCLIAIIVIAVLFLLPRLMGGNTRRVDFSRPGGERPRVDDPNISGGGAFGARPGSGNNNPSPSQGSERPRYDDPDIDGQGSFGRDRPNETRDREEHNRSPREERNTGGGFGSHVGGSQPPKRNLDDKGSGGGGGLAGFINQARGDDDNEPRHSTRPAQRDDDDKPRSSREHGSPSHDDPDISGQGGFGRNKD
ncbi:MAG: hypothetical protein U0694_16005 [Anaerolineae bacterium]